MSDPGGTRTAEWQDQWEPPGYGTYGWSSEELEPQWTPDVPLADRITKVGRFRQLDPSEPGSIWPVPRWWALAGYAAVVGWAFARAWRITGGLDGAIQRNQGGP